MPNRLHLLFLILTFCFSTQAEIKHRLIKHYNTHVYFNGNTLCRDTEVEMLIFDGLGASQSEVNIYSNNKIRNLAARIEELSGQEIKVLKRKDVIITDAYDEEAFHIDYKVNSFTLLHNRFPYILKYRYTEEYANYINLSTWYPALRFDAGIEQATLSATLPSGFEFRAMEQAIDSTSAVRNEDDGTTTYTWVVNHPRVPDQEYLSPAITLSTPHVEIIPLNFVYGLAGTTYNWATFGTWQYKLNAGLDNLTFNEKTRVHELVDHIDNEREKIRILYHHLQDHTRYINVSLDLGGLKTYPAEYVCQNKYGDCKALSNYMMALLKEAGIPSSYTIINTGVDAAPVNADYPSAQFNHVILSVPQATDTLWLECTSSGIPFNYITCSNHNRRALTVSASRSELVRTPSLSPDDCREVFSTTVDLQAGTPDIRTSAIIKGYNFEYFTALETYIPKNKLSDIIDRIRLMRGLDVSDIDIRRPHRDSSFITLDLKASAPNLTEKLGSRLMIKPLHHLTLPFEKTDQRTQDVCIHLPIARTDTIHYIAARPITEVQGFKSMEISNKYGKYKQKMHLEGRSLTLIRDFVLHAGHYPIDEYPAFYQFIDQTNQQENKKLLLSF